MAYRLTVLLLVWLFLVFMMIPLAGLVQIFFLFPAVLLTLIGIFTREKSYNYILAFTIGNALDISYGMPGLFSLSCFVLMATGEFIKSNWLALTTFASIAGYSLTMMVGFLLVYVFAHALFYTNIEYILHTSFFYLGKLCIIFVLIETCLAWLWIYRTRPKQAYEI